MESSSYETRTKSDSRKSTPQMELNMSMMELQKMKDEIKRAKDEAMESWLDSRPLIDELEKLQSKLQIAKDRSKQSKTVVSELETQLQSTYESIGSKKEEEIEIRTTINNTNQELEKYHEDMYEMKLITDEEKRERSKMKQTLRQRKQRIRTLHLTLRAIRLETEAFRASSDEANKCLNGSQLEMDASPTVEISQDEYYALRRRAKEENSLADWRVAVSMEQKVAAERSRDLALRRLDESKSERKMRRRETIGEEIGDAKHGIVREEKQDEEDFNRDSGFPRARMRSMSEGGRGNAPRGRVRRSRSSYMERVAKKKEDKSVFICFLGKIRRWFG